MKKTLLFLAFFSILSCQHSPQRDIANDSSLDKKKVKDYLRNLSVSERNQAIEKAQVTMPDYQPEKVSSIDIIEDTEKRCGPQFKYQKEVRSSQDSESGTGRSYEVYKWPQVSCLYKADDGGFGGFSAKFACDFENSSAKDGFSQKKVKYSKSASQPLKSEIVETIMATTLTRLLGFYTESYCPLEASCKNCPSNDPWGQNRGQSAPVEGRHETFPWAMTENAFSGFVVSNKVIEPQSQGLEWSELKLVDQADPIKARQMLIEREAWILWINFLQTLDAGYFNQRIYCLKAKVAGDGRPFCEESIVYTHDYGHSFYGHFNFSAWSRSSVFQKNSPPGLCRGNLLRSSIKRDWLKGDVFEPIISSEARDLLVDRLSRITQTQWSQVYQLSRAEEASQVSLKDFLRVVQSKISELKNASCAGFDTGQSVLAR